MNYRVITVSDKKPHQSYYVYDEFFKSLRGHEALVLSNELMNSTFFGLKTKPQWLYRAINEGLIKEDIIIACDCWDLLFQSHPAHIADIWHEYGADIVISSERNCFPPDLKEQYDKLQYKSSFRYLNSGMIVGSKDAIFSALEAMDLPNVPEDHRKENGQMHHTNDQQLWLNLYLQQPVKMKLDYDQRLCNTLHSMNLDELEFLENGSIKNKETGFFPCSFHMNGSAKTDGLREPILKHLNLL